MGTDTPQPFAEKNESAERPRGYVQTKKWRPQCYGIQYFFKNFRFCYKANPNNILRFHPIQIAEWMDEIRGAKLAVHGDKAVTLATDYGISKSRVLQFLALLRIPGDLRVRLKRMQWLTEGELRRIVRLDGPRQRVVVERMLRRQTVVEKAS